VSGSPIDVQEYGRLKGFIAAGQTRTSGAEQFLSATTPGKITETAPANPNFAVSVGYARDTDTVQVIPVASYKYSDTAPTVTSSSSTGSSGSSQSISRGDHQHGIGPHNHTGSTDGGLFYGPMTSVGDMIYGGAAGISSRLAVVATVGAILTSGGVGAAPTWNTNVTAISGVLSAATSITTPIINGKIADSNGRLVLNSALVGASIGIYGNDYGGANLGGQIEYVSGAGASGTDKGHIFYGYTAGLVLQEAGSVTGGGVWTLGNDPSIARMTEKLKKLGSTNLCSVGAALSYSSATT
jgi:hypothetical protein